MKAAAWFVVLAACTGGGSGGDDEPMGPGQPLQPTGSLFIVAHQGDELTYMQPALVDARRWGTTTTVYVTDGDLDHQTTADRLAALEKAYTGTTDDWSCGLITLADHEVEHCLSGQSSLVFLHYPDGGADGEHADSLLHLFDGSIPEAGGYTRDGLIATLHEVIADAWTSNVHTMEIASSHGADHSDHELVGAVSLLASSCVPSPGGPYLFAHRGDNVVAEAPNVVGADLDEATMMLSKFESPISASAQALVQRSYQVGMYSGIETQLQIEGQCMRVDGDSLTLGDCTGAPSWQFASGRLMSYDGVNTRCLQVLPTGEVAIDTTCTESTATSLYADAEGRIWSAVPPPSVGVTPGRHLYCLAAAAGRPRAVVCGDGLAPTWSLAGL